MRIAVSSQNFKTITAHAGKTRRFLIYDLPPGADVDATLATPERLDLPMGGSLHDLHGDGPMPLDGVDVLLTGSCGAGLIARLAERGTTVLVTGETDPAAAVHAVATGQPVAPPTGDDPSQHDAHHHHHDHHHEHHHEHHHGHGQGHGQGGHGGGCNCSCGH